MPNQDNQNPGSQVPPVIPDQPIDVAPPPDIATEEKLNQGGTVVTQTVVSTPPQSPPENTANLPPVITPPSSGGKRSAGKYIAGVLGLLLLVGGVGAGLLLVKQQQDIRNRASIFECTTDADCGTGAHCSNHQCVTNTPAPTPICNGDLGCPGDTCDTNSCLDCAGDTRTGTKSCPARVCNTGSHQNCTVGSCAGTQTCDETGAWGSCTKSDPSCGNPGGSTPTPNPAPQCAKALASCENGATCCGGLSCQGTAGSRVCEQPPANFCGTGTCTGFEGFRCSSLSAHGDCTNNKASESSIAAAQNYAKSGSPANCGQADAICVGGASAGQQCGDFTIYSSGCGPTSSNPPPASTPPTTQIPDCTNLSLVSGDPNNLQFGKQYTFNITAAGPAGIDNVWIFAHTANVCTNVNPYLPVPAKGPGTYQVSWTPTVVGSYVISGRIWNDSIAEGRADCVDNPPRYLFQNANSCKLNVTVKTATAPLDVACGPIKTYDTNWNQLTSAQLSALKPGNKVRLTLSGSGTANSVPVNWTKAKFMVNGVMGPEVTTKKPVPTVPPLPPVEFYYDYTIPPGVTTFNIQGYVFNDTVGWIPKI